MSWPDLARVIDLPRTDEPEQIDDPNQPFAELSRSMQDVAFTNRLFGGTQTVLHHVARLLRNVPPGTEIRILDIATGSADIPLALEAWGRKRGLKLTIVAVDNHEAMLRMAAEAAPNISLALADALSLPFPPHSFDLALCALAFHHFGFEASAQVLRTMDQLTTRGLIITDLKRDKLTLWGVQASFAAMNAHPFTRHDGPASVRRAFTPPEYRKMVGLSGVQNVRLHTHWYFRIALVQDKMGNINQSK